MSNLKLIDFDVTPYIKKKSQGANKKPLDYIEWSVVWKILNEHYKTVDFWSEKHSEYPNTLLIYLFLDDNEHQMNYPIINGMNPIPNPSQMDIHKAELRGFVKAAAKYTGLGLSLWMKDEEQSDVIKEQKRQITEKMIKSVKSVEQLTNLWAMLTESEQHRFTDLFKQQDQNINGLD